MRGKTNRIVARIAAPAAFLLAATVGVLLVRSALEAEEPAPAAVTTAATSTQAGTTTGSPTTGPGTTTGAGTTTAEPQRFYTIESGDTLAEVADEHDTTVQELLELNPGIDPTALTVGQRVRVP